MILVMLNILLFFYANLYSADTLIAFNDSIRTQYIDWERDVPTDSFLCISRSSALHGNFGLSLSTGGDEIGWRSKLPFCNEFWQRFYLRLDSVGKPVAPPPELERKQSKPLSLQLMNCALSEKNDDADPSLYGYNLEYSEQEEQVFLVLYFPESGRVVMRKIGLISPHKVYCLETHVVLFRADSVQLQVFLDGTECVNIRSGVYTLRDFIKIRVTNGHGRYLYWRVSLDDFAISRNRLYGFPAISCACTTQVDGRNTRLLSRQAFTGYLGEKTTKCRFQVFNNNDTLFPVFDVIETNPAFFQSKVIPFCLDTGFYSWRIASFNNFGNWGDWSKLCGFRMECASPDDVIIKRVYFSEVKSHVPVAAIVTGKWYDVHIAVESHIAWKSLFYSLTWLSDTNYTFGNPVNKGGIFLKTSSYIYNLNLGRGEYALYEKNTEHSFSSTRLLDGKKGLYLDASTGLISVDTIRGLIRFRARVLSETSPGPWKISSCIVYSSGKDIYRDHIEERSNLFRTDIRIISSRASDRLREKVGAGVGSILVFLAFIVWRRKNRKPMLIMETQDLDFIRVEEYIQQHLAEKVVLEGILADLKMSRRRFYALMAKYDKSLPQLINNQRISRAKKLLIENEGMGVAEIGTTVGFTEQNTFFRVFKKSEGLTPKEYRQKYKLT